MGFASLYPSYDLRRDPVHRADLVAVEIAQVSKVQFAGGAFANARRIFAGLAAIGDAGRVPGVGLFVRTSEGWRREPGRDGSPGRNRIGRDAPLR